MKKKVPENMKDCFALIQEELFEGPWVLGDKFSICDIYLTAMARWLEVDEVDTSGLGTLLDHRQRMLALPEVQKVIEMERALTS